MRPSGRKSDQMRQVSIETGVINTALSSCLVKFGNTHVICTASLDDNVPPFLRKTGSGWVTAEYGMLPGSGSSRIKREAASGKQSGRTQEIQRLIGRSLRSITNLDALGERQIIIDCDVIQADGGTRTASITGGYVALSLAFTKMLQRGIINNIPLTGQLAAVSCGIYKGNPVLDLDYAEDSNAQADSNFVITSKGQIVEIQGTAEEKPFSEEDFLSMLSLAKKGIKELTELQNKVLV